MKIRSYPLLIGLLAVLLATPAAGQSTRLRQRLLERKLTQVVTVAWQDQRLGAAASQLGQLYDVPIWRDRRVDPNQSISLTQTNQPLANVFSALAEGQSLSFAVLPGVLYLGPDDAGEQLETLLAVRRLDLSEAASEARRAWLTPLPYEWPRLSEPTSLLREAAHAAGAQLHNAEQVPHDLWDAGSATLAPLDLATIVLFGFDLTLRVDAQGRQATVVDIERPIEIVRTYSAENLDRDKLAELRKALPQATLTIDRQEVRLAGTLAQHRRFAALTDNRSADATTSPSTQATAQRQTPSGRRTRQVYTLAIENQPVGSTVTQLAGHLGLSVVWQLGENAEAIRLRRVSCKVREATLDELLEALLTPAGLAAERNGRRLEIRPR